MKCPVCNSHESSAIDLHADGFYEDIVECGNCGTTWAVSHGTTEVIKDSQEASFLEALSECVEGDDYGVVRAF